MDEQAVERGLRESERALEGDGRPDLTRLGFWRAVAAVKRDRALVDRYAARIARIDQAAFERSVPIRLPLAVGLAADVVGALVGVALVALTLSTSTGPLASSPWRELVFLAALGVLLVAPHTLAHWIVGTLVGIRFTYWFSAPPRRPQPGFKMDYASYLRTPARARAWMHASGAIVTKVVPFVLLPLALRGGLAAWAIWVIAAIGVLQIVTDAIWSVRGSDWKKFRRELRAARG